jgi:hypothetical protein
MEAILPRRPRRIRRTARSYLGWSSASSACSAGRLLGSGCARLGIRHSDFLRISDLVQRRWWQEEPAHQLPEQRAVRGSHHWPLASTRLGASKAPQGQSGPARAQNPLHPSPPSLARVYLAPCTRDVQGMYKGCTSDWLMCIPCTSLVHLLYSACGMGERPAGGGLSSRSLPRPKPRYSQAAASCSPGVGGASWPALPGPRPRSPASFILFPSSDFR